VPAAGLPLAAPTPAAGGLAPTPAAGGLAPKLALTTANGAGGDRASDTPPALVVAAGFIGAPTAACLLTPTAAGLFTAAAGLFAPAAAAGLPLPTPTGEAGAGLFDPDAVVAAAFTRPNPTGDAAAFALGDDTGDETVPVRGEKDAGLLELAPVTVPALDDLGEVFFSCT